MYFVAKGVTKGSITLHSRPLFSTDNPADDVVSVAFRDAASLGDKRPAAYLAAHGLPGIHQEMAQALVDEWGKTIGIPRPDAGGSFLRWPQNQ